MIKPDVYSKRIMFTLSPEDIRIIKLYSEQMGETPSQIIKRSLAILHHHYAGTQNEP